MGHSIFVVGLAISILLSGFQDNRQHEATLSIEETISDVISTDIIDLHVNESENAHFTVEMTDDVWESANMENSKFLNKDEFIFEVENYIKEISKFLNGEKWFDVYKEKHGYDYICHIEYRMTPGASHVENGYMAYFSLIPNVYLNKDLFEHDLAPIAHETTHIIVPFYSSLSLREGLASYCQDKFGANPTVFNWGLDVHAYSKLYLMNEKEEFDKVFSVIGTADAMQNIYAQGNSREFFYNLSYSFTKYVIDTFGIDKFMKLYESEDLINDYSVVCGKSLNIIKDDWYKSLEFYSESLTFEEIQEHKLGLSAEHNDSVK